MKKKVLLLWPNGMRGIFPLSMGYLFNSVRSIGDRFVEVSILDCSVDEIPEELFIEKIHDADFVGISVWGFNLDNVKKHIDIVRNHSKAILITGGASSHLVDHDYAIVGEGEAKLKKIISHHIDGTAEQLLSMPGIVPKGGQLSFHDSYITDLDSLNSIDYDLLQLNKYLSSGYKDWMYTLKDKFRSAPLMTTRGCPYNCAYCQGPVIMGHKIRHHSIQYVINSIKNLYENFNIRQFSIIDDNLTFYTDFAKDLCRQIIRFKTENNFSFIMTTPNGVRVNKLDEELISLMKKAGWAEIIIAPESGSQRVLKLMRKRVDLNDMNRKIDLIHKHRMTAVGFFLSGYRGENKDDLDTTRDFILNSKFDRVTVNFFVPTPGTPVYEEMKEHEELVSDFNVVKYKSINYIPNDLTREQMEEFSKAIEVKTKFKEKWIKDL